MSESGSERPGGKVARVLEKYDIEGLGGELERRWTGAEGERDSLRDLADYLNRAVLRTALDGTDATPLDGSVEHIYRLLRDDDVREARRIEARRQLERVGVDIDELENDFVSHQSVHTYLREGRGAELPEADADRTEKVSQRVRRLQGRTRAVTENGLDQLIGNGELGLGEYDVFVDVQVYCTECDSQFDVGELLQRGTCNCP